MNCPTNVRNERLAKWRGWKPEKLCRAMTGASCRPDFTCPGYGLRHSDEMWEACIEKEESKPPSYDTDPAAALELLGWLVAKPREWYSEITSDNVFTHIALTGINCTAQAKVNGLPFTALPEAIAEVAEEVLDMEEGDLKSKREGE